MNTKEILKKVLKSKIPRAPIDNRKRGFSVPLGKWMKNQDVMEQMFFQKETSLVDAFGMDRNEFKQLQNNHLAGKVDAKWPLFTLRTL